MMRIATIASTALLAAAIALLIVGLWLDPADHHLSLGNEFHVGVGTWRQEWDVRITFFSDELGPYRGGALWLNGGQPPYKMVGSADAPGIYFRWARGRPPFTSFWTLAVSLWYAVIVSAILPMVWWVRHRRGASA